MMNQRFQQILPVPACRTTFSTTLGFVICAAVLPVLSAASAGPHRATEAVKTAEPPGTHSSVVRSGTLETRDGLTLRLTTDLGPVKVFQLEAGAAPVVRYTVHIETDAHGPAAQKLLDSYALKARSTSYGVEITGALPQQVAHSTDAQFWVQFEVTVPKGYSVEVNTEAGDIETQDIGGTASLHTQDEVNILGDIVLRKPVDERGKTDFVLQQGGDVVEKNSLPGEIGDFADQMLELVCIQA